MQLLLIGQTVVAALLVVSILLQNRGSGLGVVGGDFGGSHHTKRGIEKFLLNNTIVLSAIFLLLSLINVAAQ